MRITNEIIDRVLQNNATAEEAREVAAWFATPEGQKEFAKRIEAESEATVDMDCVDSERIQRVYNRWLAQTKKHKIRTWRRMVAAVLVPFLMLAGGMSYLIGLNYGATSDWVEVIAANGEKAQVLLTDGTRIFINAGTTLRYPSRFSRKERKVYLDGQAYFYVDANAGKPFKVDVTGAEVVVTGTEFDVEAYSNTEKVVVTLDEGGVTFVHEGRVKALKVNQQLVYNRADKSKTIINMDDYSYAASWRANRISLRDAPLQDLLDKMSRQYDVDFKVLDEKLQHYTYSIVSDDEPLDELLNRIERITPIQFIKHDDTIEVHPN